MPRHASLVRMRHIHTTIPEPLWQELEAQMHSPLEGSIPRGDLQSLLVRLLRQHLSYKELDLSPFLSLMPGEATILADPRVISSLLNHLTKETS